MGEMISEQKNQRVDAPVLQRRRQLRGVLLDIDGTLLDSNGAHARAWCDAMAGEGISLSHERLRRQIGKGGEKLLWDLLDIKASSPLGKAISSHKERIFRSTYLPDLGAFPDTRTLLERLRQRGLSLHVATSSSDKDVQDLLRKAGVSDLIAGGATKDDAARSKPDPDIVNAAVERSGRDKGELLMLGDTPYDITSAAAAGVGIVALRNRGWERTDLAGAIAIYEDASDLLSHWDDSPFASA